MQHPVRVQEVEPLAQPTNPVPGGPLLDRVAVWPLPADGTAGQVDEERLSQEVRSIYRAVIRPEPAILGMRTVIAQDKVLVRAEGDNLTADAVAGGPSRSLGVMNVPAEA